MMVCNSCIDDMDPRYNDDDGCIGGVLYGHCDSEFCYGLCEDMGSCTCECHK